MKLSFLAKVLPRKSGYYACGEKWGGQHIHCSCSSAYRKSAPQTDPIADDRRWAALFHANPLAFWLDPELWGPLPKPGKTAIRGETRPELPVADAPPCPICPDGGKRTVMAIHGGEATMWDCFVCGCEFTRAGETKKSRNKRRSRKDLAWERRAAAVHASMAENHGSCPGECGMPVDKRGDMYYCSDSQCHRNKRGWK
jgi:hypothetical protein